jgi:hypothetical protein
MTVVSVAPLSFCEFKVAPREHVPNLKHFYPVGGRTVVLLVLQLYLGNLNHEGQNMENVKKSVEKGSVQYSIFELDPGINLKIPIDIQGITRFRPCKNP